MEIWFFKPNFGKVFHENWIRVWVTPNSSKIKFYWLLKVTFGIAAAKRFDGKLQVQSWKKYCSFSSIIPATFSWSNFIFLILWCSYFKNNLKFYSVFLFLNIQPIEHLPNLLNFVYYQRFELVYFMSPIKFFIYHRIRWSNILSKLGRLGHVTEEF